MTGSDVDDVDFRLPVLRPIGKFNLIKKKKSFLKILYFDTFLSINYVINVIQSIIQTLNRVD